MAPDPPSNRRPTARIRSCTVKSLILQVMALGRPIINHRTASGRVALRTPRLQAREPVLSPVAITQSRTMLVEIPEMTSLTAALCQLREDCMRERYLPAPGPEDGGEGEA